MRLLSSQGELVRGRCGSTNQCAYCARLAAVENAELLALDALAGSAPAIWAVLTTSRPLRDPRAFYRAREAVVKALRRRWPGCEYAALVEFTTGYGLRAGGARRPHWNLLIKGVPAEQLDDAAGIIRGVWCRRPEVGARPEAQHVGTIGEFGGLMRYVALHFQKESQAPPPGWRGHRFIHSHGYLAGSTPEAREQARRSLRHKRELWRAIHVRGLGPHDAELAAAEAMAIAEATSWRTVNLVEAPGRSRARPSPRVEVVDPAGHDARDAGLSVLDSASDGEGDGLGDRPIPAGHLAQHSAKLRQVLARAGRQPRVQSVRGALVAHGPKLPPGPALLDGLLGDSELAADLRVGEPADPPAGHGDGEGVVELVL
ncbi:MAG TPA: hypothetical protein VF069_27500 [Streptosporangiaceae bacterium]